jgi:hypothetical protein
MELACEQRGPIWGVLSRSGARKTAQTHASRPSCHPRASCFLSCAMRPIRASTSATVLTSCGCSATSSACMPSTCTCAERKRAGPLGRRLGPYPCPTRAPAAAAPSPSFPRQLPRHFRASEAHLLGAAGQLLKAGGVAFALPRVVGARGVEQRAVGRQQLEVRGGRDVVVAAGGRQKLGARLGHLSRRGRGG